jgi:hypothetical protein
VAWQADREQRGVVNPLLMHDPRALAQRDPRPWPARNRRPVGRLRNLEVIDASDVLNDAIRGAVPDIHAEGKVDLGLHKGQIPLDWPAPRAIYTPIMLLRRVAFPDFCEPCLPSPAEKPPAGAGWLQRDQTRRLQNAGAPRWGGRAAASH